MKYNISIQSNIFQIGTISINDVQFNKKWLHFIYQNSAVLQKNLTE